MWSNWWLRLWSRYIVQANNSYIDSFRRFVKDIGTVINPEYDFLDISKGLPSISDYGNIQIASPHKPSQAELLEKLSTKIGLCIKRSNIPFIVGGTRDQTYALVKALDKRSLTILFRAEIDMKEMSSVITQQNSLTNILTLEKNQVIVLGPQLQDSKVSVITYKDIRNQQIQPQPCSMMDPITQCGQLFHQILTEAQLNPDINQIAISFSMECIENIIGVSNKVSQGITTEEVIEILKIAGAQGKKVVAVDVCDYNPFKEDWTTGRLLSTMFYYFALGLSARLQQF